jgi:hypothetical protein
MYEQKQTMACIFEASAPRVTAYDVHEWVSDTLQVSEESVISILIDNQHKTIYIKLVEQQCIDALVTRTSGVVEFKHPSSEITHVRLEQTGMGPHRVRLQNLPIEVPNMEIYMTLAPYGNVQSVVEERWSPNLHYKVYNGMRTAVIVLKMHIPSTMLVGGYRARIYYEGQPQTCYACGEADHLYPECPRRNRAAMRIQDLTNLTWAQRVKAGPPRVDPLCEEVEIGDPRQFPVPGSSAPRAVDTNLGGEEVVAPAPGR